MQNTSRLVWLFFFVLLCFVLFWFGLVFGFVLFLRGDGGGGFGFLGFFVHQCLQQHYVILLHLLKNQVVDCNMCWGFFCLVGFWLGFF